MIDNVTPRHAVAEFIHNRRDFCVIMLAAKFVQNGKDRAADDAFKAGRH
jgi:hypothetical protein